MMAQAVHLFWGAFAEGMSEVGVSQDGTPLYP